MKSCLNLFVFILFCLFTINTNSQDWVNQQNFRLNSIFFIDNDYGWAVGLNGVVLRTTNGGSNWIKENSGTTEWLDDVFFINQSIGWICGDHDQTRKTTDGGVTWVRMGSTPQGNALHSLHFVDENTGWVVGINGIYKTTDSGNSWINQLYGTNRVRSVFFTDSEIGWAAYEDGHLKRTTDGGTNWLDATTNPGGIYLAIDFVDNNYGWVVGGDDCVRKTADGGETWIAVSTLGFSGQTYWGLKFISSTTGWIVGTNGIILKTTNAGLNWIQQSTLTTDQLMSITIAGTSGWVCGYNGRILKNSAANPVPVELSSFTASVKNNLVKLNWKTETEIDNYGFDIERAMVNSKFEFRNPKFEKIGFVEGHGNCNSPKYYSFTDEKPFGGSKFQYRLKQIDTDGKFEYSDIVEVEIIPVKFELYQNYPNPFNPVTTIRFQLPKGSNVNLKIYDICGAEVLELINSKREAGIYEVELNELSLPSGTYIYRIVADQFIDSKKMVLLK